MPPDTAPGTAFYSMVGNSSEFLALQHKAARVARGDNNLLLQGEPGTGKQRLAHGIHQASPRAAAPLITVRGHDGSEAELEAEFFGSDDGAGHVTAGALELANGGTLFLDEIENSPPSWKMPWRMPCATGSGTGKPAPAGNTMCG